MSADFEQIVVDSENNVVEISKGTVEFLRPKKFRWNYKQPYEQLLISDGRHLWFYDKDLEQVIKKNLDGAIESSPAAFLGGLVGMEENFLLSEMERKENLDRVEVLPLKEDASFESIIIGFAEKKLTRIEVLDYFAQKTIFRFSRYNQDPFFDKGHFVFIPPKNVDIILE